MLSLHRFTTTDPIIANVFDGQALNAFAYVRNNPLAFVDPSGFTEEEAWRLWRVEETGQLGIHITFDQLTPPTSRPAPPAAVGEQAPANDVDTTGSDDGGEVELPIIESPHPSGPPTLLSITMNRTPFGAARHHKPHRTALSRKSDQRSSLSESPTLPDSVNDASPNSEDRG